MAINNFKAFALDPNANVMSQADWEALPALLSGFTAGKASSAQVNKAIRQSTFITSAVAQFVSDALTQDILDDGDSQAFVAKLKQSIVNGSVPAGIPMPWPDSSPPSGWLKCNGASFNTTEYPLLAKAYPSGKLPDLRGEFIRGWDDGRRIDSGRVIMSSQGDTLKSHGHTVQIAVNPADDPYRNILGYGTGGSDKLAVKANSTTSIYGNPPLVNSSGDGETRPRNIAFNYIVRAV